MKPTESFIHTFRDTNEVRNHEETEDAPRTCPREYLIMEVNHILIRIGLEPISV